MPGFDDQSVRRIARTVQTSEKRLRGRREKRGRWNGKGGWEEITVVTDFRVDTSTLTLQIKTRLIRVLRAEDESDWIDVHTGTACTPAGSGS